MPTLESHTIARATEAPFSVMGEHAVDFELNRAYKHKLPFETINKIRAILLDLKCNVFEILWAHPYDEIYSVRIQTELSDGSFGQNGKGRNRAYTLASAYAEFIERLQNGILANFSRRFLEYIKKESGFYYYPDERFIPSSEFDLLPSEYLKDVCSYNTGGILPSDYIQRLKANGYSGCIGVPFYDTKNNCIVYLPHNLTQGLTGSNGMAAGNTMPEGIFQAICEILERFGAASVYDNRLTPPTIPRDFLSQFPTEWKIIQKIEESGVFEVIVKDFSCGKHLPSVGVIIRHRDRELYKLNVGSDTCFPVALSRALTEIHQGISSIDEFEKVLLPIPQVEHKYFFDDSQKSIIERKNQFMKFMVNGSGVFPLALFGSTDSYQFDPSTFVTHGSYQEECRYLISLVHNLGHNVYLRDVSYLGFPSYFVYIPVMSPVGKKTVRGGHGGIDFSKLEDVDQVEDLFFPFEKCDPEKMKALASILEKVQDVKMNVLLKFEVQEGCEWETLPPAFFLTLFWYKLGFYEKALTNFELLSKEVDTQGEYYKVVHRLLLLSSSGTNLYGIKTQLISEKYGTNTIDEVIKAFSRDGKHLFDGVNIPQCPKCENCGIRTKCLTSGRKELTVRLNRMMANTKISQNTLVEVSPA